MRHATRLTGALILCLAATVLAGCGGDSGSAPRSSGRSEFAWLAPAPAPTSWRVLTNADGSASLSLPPGWRRIYADPGAVAGGLGGDALRGYLNVTPQQSGETLGNWASFRLGHNRDESHGVVMRALAQGLIFRGGAKGSCLIDDYDAHVGAIRYREIACLIMGRRATNVVLAAAPLPAWPTRSAELQRAISAFFER